MDSNSVGMIVTRFSSTKESITMKTSNASSTPAFRIKPFVPIVELIPRRIATALKIPLRISHTIKKTTNVSPATGTTVPIVELIPRRIATALKIPLRISHTIKKTTNVSPATGTTTSCENFHSEYRTPSNRRLTSVPLLELPLHAKTLQSFLS